MTVNQSYDCDLSIIILNYNGRFWLEKLLPSLKANYLDNTSYSVKVIIVDNGSSDNSNEYLEEFDWIRLIKSDKNGGFAYGNNIALRNISSKYALLLNSDTELPEKGCDLDLLIDYMDRHEEAGIITPKLILDDGSADPACHRGEPTIWASLTYFIKLEKLFPHSRIFARYHQSYKDYGKTHKIDACTGAAMLVRMSAVNIVGMLDERFFMYAEDLDWCRRFRENGFNIIFFPEVTLLHHKYKSGIKNNNTETKSLSRKSFYGTMLQYYDKYYADYPGIFRAILKYFLKRKASA